jgi:murein DD-endopeptidase MepM/ murein hydrolase activator NlpD
MKRRHDIRLLTGAPLAAAVALAVALPAWAATETSGTTTPEEASAPAGAAEESPSGAPAPTDRSTAADRPSSAAGAESEESAEASARKGRKFGERTLRRGDKGSDVRRLHKVLRHLNFKVKVSRRFGKDTQRQVRRFDLWKEKKANGVVHPKQATRMKRMDRRGARYRRHVFPVRGPHSYGSSGSRFGAPRSGHTHQGQDVAAAEGTKLVAAHEGRVAYKQYQAGGAGHYLVIHGKDGSDSVYMHLVKPPRVNPGERVLAGTKIGLVGNTGSSTGPHLHFELWTPRWYNGGRAYDPLPKLLKWDRRT